MLAVGTFGSWFLKISDEKMNVCRLWQALFT
jgi:hypothetical protein